MADDIDNDDQWLYGDNQEPEPEPPKEAQEKHPQSEPPAESKSPPTVSFVCILLYELSFR